MSRHVRAKELVGQMELMEAIMKRHTVWQFEPRTVEREKLLAVVEAARWAPSGGNTQPWDFLVVTDPALKPEMVRMIKLAHSRWMTEAAVLPQSAEDIAQVHEKIDTYTPPEVSYVTLCMRFKEYYIPERRPKPEFIHPMNYQSMGAAVENLLLAAVENGLGTHWVGATSMVQSEMVKLFGIPEETEVLGTVVIGYPGKESSMRGGVPIKRARLPIEEIAHFDRW